jgi:hypothetical protein
MTGASEPTVILRFADEHEILAAKREKIPGKRLSSRAAKNWRLGKISRELDPRSSR